jgi:hypothetical protein
MPLTIGLLSAERTGYLKVKYDYEAFEALASSAWLEWKKFYHSIACITGVLNQQRLIPNDTVTPFCGIAAFLKHQ